ncbi:MAG: hypothetical protein J6X38_05970, partial [Abditibacteriota bacterium]|nr:hypothetical protein [Abditibacteriota bacterium]
SLRSLAGMLVRFLPKVGLVWDLGFSTHQVVILMGLVCDSGGFTHLGRYYFVILASVLKYVQHQNNKACTIKT